MKNLQLVALGAIAVVLIGCSKSESVKTVLSPSVAQAAEHLTVDKVILTDSMTIIDFSFTPGPEGSWVRIAPTASISADGGKKLQIIGTKNIPMGETPTETFMFRDYTFSLIFPPISRKAKSLDFAEGGEGGWTIKGINLDGKSTTVAYADTAANREYAALALAYEREVQRLEAQREAQHKRELAAAQQASQQKFYCKLCGKEFPSIKAMYAIGERCYSHPTGKYGDPWGKHVPY
ncbi:MAG: hypothetical protein LIP02_13395 [Bacteroidales bacterium]|nr:hypothetical protein [Bacteroidales bacterium]